MAAVRLQQLQKIFSGDVRAVDNLSLDVVSGELLVVVGPSGCGKTTTLRLIAGLETPTGGAIQIGDRDITQMAPAKRNVAMAFQDHALYPHLNVYENLAFGLRMRGAKRAEFDADIRRMSELLQLGSLIDRQVHELSEGQRQRVALGRALVRKPDCFLLDEPLASLDETLRGQLRDEIRRLHRELATTMIFVTHDQHEAMLLGDRIAVLDEGRLQQCGTPEEVYRHPANRRVARLIGTPTMNLLPGRLQIVGDRLQFVAGSWQLPIANDHVSTLTRHVDQEVFMGIRPQAVQLTMAPSSDTSSETAGDKPSAGLTTAIPVQVASTQSLGDAEHLQLSLPDGQPLTARFVSGAAAQTGTTCHVEFDPAGVHFFDARGEGQNLLSE